MNFTEKLFLLEYLSAQDIKAISNGTKRARDLLDSRIYFKYLELLKYTRPKSYMVNKSGRQ